MGGVEGSLDDGLTKFKDNLIQLSMNSLENLIYLFIQLCIV